MTIENHPTKYSGLQGSIMRRYGDVSVKHIGGGKYTGVTPNGLHVEMQVDKEYFSEDLPSEVKILAILSTPKWSFSMYA